LLPAWTPLAIGTVLLTFAVVRNIPVYPFTLLAPHELPVAAVPADQPES
jgi:hypothetical protein